MRKAASRRNAACRNCANSAEDISPEAIANSRCFTLPSPLTLSMGKFQGGSVKTICAFSDPSSVSNDLGRDSPDEPRTGVDGSDRLDWAEAQLRGVDGSGIPDRPNGSSGDFP